ncbi:MAG: hypothetical protein AB1611_07005 [bacterium]
MNSLEHTFYIPVMGTGHSVDTPIRLAPLGISSVISLVDDILLEKVRKFYSEKFGLSYTPLGRSEVDGRAKRITAYLDTVWQIVQIKMAAIKQQPFFAANDKSRYFELLPDESPLKKEYDRLLGMDEGPERDALANDLTGRMRPGSIDVNIMVKLDRTVYDAEGKSLGEEFTDAKAALRGYANSALESCIVFSAGINQKLFNYLTRFQDFYRDKTGWIRKKIIVKVSDFRSALIQGKFLAKKGLEISEFRIESGLNCGGHAFPSNGNLLPCLLQEFKDKREQLAAEFLPFIQKYYRSQGWKYPESAVNEKPLISVQGGIGVFGEVCRLRKDFGMDMTGWASPFLLVPEATPVDHTTRELLIRATEDDFYISDISPLGVPFNTIRRTGSEVWTREMAARDTPGSPCSKGCLVSNTEFTETPICLASRTYQTQKLAQIDRMEIPEKEKARLRARVVEKACICDHLGNGALISLGIAKEQHAPQAICPGPNIVWFKRLYTLKEMVDHIYGRRPSLVPSERPHMFAQEIVMYVDYFEKLISNQDCTEKEIAYLQEFYYNLEHGMDFCLAIAQNSPYPGENLASIPPCVEQQRARLRSLYGKVEKKINIG